MKAKLPKEIRITVCHSAGPEFALALPGTLHRVVAPPKDYLESQTGLWIMGITKPIKLYVGEYTPVEPQKTAESTPLL